MFLNFVWGENLLGYILSLLWNAGGSLRRTMASSESNLALRSYSFWFRLVWLSKESWYRLMLQSLNISFDVEVCQNCTVQLNRWSVRRDCWVAFPFSIWDFAVVWLKLSDSHRWFPQIYFWILTQSMQIENDSQLVILWDQPINHLQGEWNKLWKL